jgi:pimeloyl-ACP methyl ester carboxylesterase
MSGWRDLQARQHVCELGDRYLAYLDEGEGEPLVLLHGMPTWGLVWEPVLAALARSYRVLVPDLLGYGWSDKRDGFDRSVARQAAWMDAWLAAIGVRRAHLVGHDIGGAVALRMAIVGRERVAHLVVADTVSYDAWPPLPVVELASPTATRSLSAAELCRRLADRLAGGFQGPPDQTVLGGLLAPYRTDVGKRSLVRAACALNTSHTTELLHHLPRLHVPTLVLWGEEDPFQPAELGERLAWDIPNARFQAVAGARHFLMHDRPAEVATLILDFLAHPRLGRAEVNSH